LQSQEIANTALEMKKGTTTEPRNDEKTASFPWFRCGSNSCFCGFDWDFAILLPNHERKLTLGIGNCRIWADLYRSYPSTYRYPAWRGMSNIFRKIAMLALFVVLVGCSGKPDDNASVPQSPTNAGDIAKIAEDYKGLQLMTPEPVFVNPELAMLCVGASREMVDDARIEKGPHANCSVEIYMNQLASNAFSQNKVYPVGAVVVKKKEILGYRTKDKSDWDGTGNGVGGMIKRNLGFDADNGDWEYFYFETSDNIESGRMMSCVKCHSNAADTDYVFGSWKKNGHSTEAGY